MVVFIFGGVKYLTQRERRKLYSAFYNLIHASDEHSSDLAGVLGDHYVGESPEMTSLLPVLFISIDFCLLSDPKTHTIQHSYTQWRG